MHSQAQRKQGESPRTIPLFPFPYKNKHVLSWESCVLYQAYRWPVVAGAADTNFSTALRGLPRASDKETSLSLRYFPSQDRGGGPQLVAPCDSWQKQGTGRGLPQSKISNVHDQRSLAQVETGQHEKEPMERTSYGLNSLRSQHQHT